jgi:hypothetical protein
MAENEDKLYRLIHSLDKSEKGFVKKFAALHVKEDANGVRLFDIYNKVIPYEESKLEKLLVKEKYYGHLPKVKNYLYELILKALRNYYIEKDEYFRLNTIIQNATILKNKRLNKEALSVIKKVKKECLEQERWLLLSEANGIERQLQPSFYVSPEEYFAGFSSWRTEDDTHKEMHYAGRFITEMYYKVFYLIHQLDKTERSELVGKINEITSSNDYLSYQKIETVRVQTLHLKIKLYEHFLKDERNEFHLCSKRLLEYYSDRNILNIYLPPTVVGLLNNLALIAILFGDEDAFNDSLDLLQQTRMTISDSNETVQAMSENCISYLNCYYFLKKGWFLKGLDLCKQKLHDNDVLDDALNENKATLFYYQSIFQFHEGKFSDSIKSLNAIDLYTEKHTSIGLESESYLIKILCHIELGNYDSADYLAKKYAGFLDKKAPLFKQRINLVQSFFIMNNSSKENLIKEYNSRKNNIHHQDQLVGVCLFDIDAWLDSQVKQIDVAKVYQQKFDALKTTFIK